VVAGLIAAAMLSNSNLGQVVQLFTPICLCCQAL